MNFYAMENNGGTAWSPILGQGNFHRASRFGRVTWSSKRSHAVADAGAPSVAAPADASAGTGLEVDPKARVRLRPNLPNRPAPNP